MDTGHYLIVGLGKTGHSIARYLQKCDASFAVFDTRVTTDALEPFRKEFPEAAIFLGTLPEAELQKVVAVITSPGVPLDTPCIQRAQQLGLPIYGDIECLARAVSVPMITITGTNGKSTVTTLAGLMVQASGFDTAVAGNIGAPVLDVLAENKPHHVWVLELSSFQLDLTESLRSFAATILNISPDHLDRHHTMQNYIQAKQRIYLGADYLLYNRDDPLTKPQTVNASQVMTSFGLDKPEDGQWGIVTHAAGTFLMYGKIEIMNVADMRIKGCHNWANALAACALVHHLGVAVSCMRQVLREFSGLPHRSQWVRTINDVDWINDSKGTNVGATQSAIAGIGGAISGKIVLIAGGQGKGADFKLLRDPVTNYVRSLVLLGQDADKLEAALHDVVTVTRVTTLEDAVGVAHQVAQPGDVVLLSPACASLDMFHDFNHRGEVFTALVEQL
jgi:UDP-N-acetylmuramoylalanine--D-glutamate ligase